MKRTKCALIRKESRHLSGQLKTIMEDWCNTFPTEAGPSRTSKNKYDYSHTQHLTRYMHICIVHVFSRLNAVAFIFKLAAFVALASVRVRHLVYKYKQYASVIIENILLFNRLIYLAVHQLKIWRNQM